MIYVKCFLNIRHGHACSVLETSRRYIVLVASRNRNAECAVAC
jgi:hypothetical protein